MTKRSETFCAPCADGSPTGVPGSDIDFYCDNPAHPGGEFDVKLLNPKHETGLTYSVNGSKSADLPVNGTTVILPHKASGTTPISIVIKRGDKVIFKLNKQITCDCPRTTTTTSSPTTTVPVVTTTPTTLPAVTTVPSVTTTAAVTTTSTSMPVNFPVGSQLPATGAEVWLLPALAVGLLIAGFTAWRAGRKPKPTPVPTPAPEAQSVTLTPSEVTTEPGAATSGEK